MSEYVIRPTAVVLLLVGQIIFQGCSQFAEQRCMIDAGRHAVQLAHSSGGPGPVITWVTIDLDGKLEYISSRQRLYCGVIPSERLVELRELLRNPELHRVAREAQEQGSFKSDYEEFEIISDGLDVAIPAEDVPAEVQALLDLIERSMRDAIDQAPPWKNR